MKSALIVAGIDPHTPYISAEVDALTAILSADTLTHRVTAAAVAEQLSIRPIDLLWFAAHGADGAIWFANGESIGASELAALAGGYEPLRLIVINTCEAEGIANSLHARTGAAVAYTLAPTGDQLSYLIGRRFAEQLAEGASVREAQRSIGSGLLRLVPDYEGPPGVIRAIQDTQADHARRLDDHGRRLFRLEAPEGRSVWLIVAGLGLIGCGILLWYLG